MPSFIRFIPTPSEDVPVFADMARLSPSDVVYDLGSGDGRLIFAAIEKGVARAVGIDLDPECLRMSREEAKRRGVEDKVAFVEADVMEVDLSPATVVFCYLITAASAALKPKFERELKRGTRVVMESFPVPGWKPDNTWEYGYGHFYLYEMPPELMD
jgi:ubiquinone/menaquinone biosynthesis C-methylase UbiE